MFQQTIWGTLFHNIAPFGDRWVTDLRTITNNKRGFARFWKSTAWISIEIHPKSQRPSDNGGKDEKGIPRIGDTTSIDLPVESLYSWGYFGSKLYHSPPTIEGSKHWMAFSGSIWEKQCCPTSLRGEERNTSSELKIDADFPVIMWTIKDTAGERWVRTGNDAAQWRRYQNWCRVTQKNLKNYKVRNSLS